MSVSCRCVPLYAKLDVGQAFVTNDANKGEWVVCSDQGDGGKVHGRSTPKTDHTTLRDRVDQCPRDTVIAHPGRSCCVGRKNLSRNLRMVEFANGVSRDSLLDEDKKPSSGDNPEQGQFYQIALH